MSFGFFFAECTSDGPSRNTKKSKKKRRPHRRQSSTRKRRSPFSEDSPDRSSTRHGANSDSGRGHERYDKRDHWHSQDAYYSRGSMALHDDLRLTAAAATTS